MSNPDPARVQPDPLAVAAVFGHGEERRPGVRGGRGSRRPRRRRRGPAPRARRRRRRPGLGGVHRRPRPDRGAPEPRRCRPGGHRARAGRAASTARWSRDTAAEFARAVPHHKTLAVEVPPDATGISPAEFAQAVTEGVILARWRFRVGAGQDETHPRQRGARRRRGRPRRRPRGRPARAGRRRRLQPRPRPGELPATTLTAARMAEVAEQLGAGRRAEVESFGKEQLDRDGLRRDPRRQHGQRRAAAADPWCATRRTSRPGDSP